ncbi:hypothetical protein EV2_033759 [Malus domestica]
MSGCIGLSETRTVGTNSFCAAPKQQTRENGIVDCIPRLLAARKRIRHTERRSVFGSERVDLAAVARREENYA